MRGGRENAAGGGRVECMKGRGDRIGYISEHETSWDRPCMAPGRMLL